MGGEGGSEGTQPATQTSRDDSALAQRDLGVTFRPARKTLESYVAMTALEKPA